LHENGENNFSIPMYEDNGHTRLRCRRQCVVSGIDKIKMVRSPYKAFTNAYYQSYNINTSLHHLNFLNSFYIYTIHHKRNQYNFTQKVYRYPSKGLNNLS
jgi:hypothetical protein